MCRLAAYMGPEIYISSLVTEPRHSLIHQSYHAKERIEPLNGDGFGIGWYAPRFCNSPALFKAVSPAWNNRNLAEMARVTQSGCIFAHVRAATSGGHVSRSNCHPFSWENYLFMHNGTIHGFQGIQRRLRASLSDEAYFSIAGDTDSEHLFAMFVDRIASIGAPTMDDLKRSLVDAVASIEKMKKEAGVDEPSTMNLVLSDGNRIVATRFASGDAESNSLYYATMERFRCENGMCSIDDGDKGVLIVSEPLEELYHWQKIPHNHVIAIDHEIDISIKDM